MSIWVDIHKQSNGDIKRKEDIARPLHIITARDLNVVGVKYLGRVDGHDTNPFYPKGLGEFYQVTNPNGIILNGVYLGYGDTIIGYYNSHWDCDYYLYTKKSPIIK